MLGADGVLMLEIACHLLLADESDVGVARRRTRELAEEHGLPPNAGEALATAVCEIARNVIVHAGRGELLLGVARDGRRAGVVAVARDDGPGIPSMEDAMRDGYSTGDGLGLGLPSAQRLVDEFEIRSVVGQGTTVTVRKWAPISARNV
jgi:serine/threonine-protein kinase RsbT